MRTATKIFLAASCALIACSGAQTTPLVATQQVPAAEGRVQTRRTSNQNTDVDVSVEFLAPPNRVAPDATTYVVWAQALGDGSKPQNVGAMRVGADRTGSLKTKTPHQSFDLMVTPEASPTAAEPTNEPVLKATVVK